MKKQWLTVLLLMFSFVAKAQFNNEWIDYDKTYYKIRVGVNGATRITQSALVSAGLADVPAEDFQLFRNGVEVPVYTSKPSGILGAADFIEFMGETNDGKLDDNLYPNPSQRLSNRYSLLTDSSAYFLTVAPGGNHLRIVDQANNVAGNTLPATPYFMDTYVSASIKNKIHPGRAAVVGEYVYSATYETGEGWSSRDILPSSPLTDNRNNLAVSPVGPDPTIRISMAGSAQNARVWRVFINGNMVIEESTTNFFQNNERVATFPLSYLGKPVDTIRIATTSNQPTDRMVAGKIEMTYPRQFNLIGLRFLDFNLPANPNGHYLDIASFNYPATSTPVLYDLTNQKRYTAVKFGTRLRFVIPPGGDRHLALLNVSGLNYTEITALKEVKFENFLQKQGDFVIISNSRLYNGANGNPVDAYKNYRNSAEGGSYNAQIYDIEQLVDQFAYGVKQHPLSVKNFLLYARQKFNVKPKYVLLIGRGVTYDQYRLNQGKEITDRLNLVPTFGSPASDNLLASDDFDAIAETPIGRIAAVNPQEVENYLNKVKEHDNVMKIGSQTFNDRAWMKNVVHAIGGSDPYLQSVIFGYMNAATKILEDTSFGGKVYSFSKNSAFAVQQLTSDQLKALFEEGINLITYFGHSSANTLEFNLDEPSVYNNKGKYPMFIVNGCNAGNIFVYDTLRVTTGYQTLSEKYLLANQRGCIGFMASTHYGVVAYLNIFTYKIYEAIAQDYNKSIGELNIEAAKGILATTGPTDFFGKLHAEEIQLHGDPSIKLYPHPKADYIIESQFVKFSPEFISVANNTFDIDLKFFNIGKAVGDSITIDVRRQLPNGKEVVLYKSKIPGIRYMDSLKLKVQINPLTDKGENKLIVYVDAEDRVDEITENNNQLTKSFYIVEDEARPVSPLNLSIVNTSSPTFYASAASYSTLRRNYHMEIDTTELFNSPWKKSQTISSAGGLLQFSPPGLILQDSVVYYWRTSPDPATGGSQIWNSASFVYLQSSGDGFNQSHFFQHQKDEFNGIKLDTDRLFRYKETPAKLTIKNGLYPYFEGFDIGVTLGTDIFTDYGCAYSSLQIFVYDSLTLQPWANNIQPDGFGRFGSYPPCVHNRYCFEFPYAAADYRKKAVEFLESIPAGHFISISNFAINKNGSFIAQWQNDTTTLGSNRSLYHVLKNMGFAGIDMFTHNIPFVFFAKKGVPSYPVVSRVGTTESDYLDVNIDLNQRMDKGEFSSPWLGPAIEWKRLIVNRTDLEAQPDSVGIAIYGRDYDGNESLITQVHNSKDTSISFIDAKTYPFLRLKMVTKDTANATPQQLKYWRLLGVFPPEGAIAATEITSLDTVEIGQEMKMNVTFKNISNTAFDSLKVDLIITDKDNVAHPQNLPLKKPLQPNDTVMVSLQLDSKNFPEATNIFLNFNPNYHQPEQYLFNNFIFKSFYVKTDSYHPTLDVTFDGVHILNRDIVSAKPKILVELKDNNKFLALDDTSLLQVKIKYPNGDIRQFRFDGDTLKFNPANLTGGNTDNTASIDFAPSFLEDGEYELMVNGKDKSGNASGSSEYRVVFTVINKPMISNLLNYPNPFTTSTAFVFTVTGSEPPQNLRIQILTITGKIVREITKQELGPIHIGRNITEFKWDGTDQYGQKLANGVYLYRVITNLNGKSLEKYKAEGDKTDQYFRAGYGKMYLMR